MISAKKSAKMQSLIILKQLGKILGVRIYPILRYLKVHKIENFFDSDFEFCVISLLVMLKY